MSVYAPPSRGGVDLEAFVSSLVTFNFMINCLSELFKSVILSIISKERRSCYKERELLPVESSFDSGSLAFA